MYQHGHPNRCENVTLPRPLSNSLVIDRASTEVSELTRYSASTPSCPKQQRSIPNKHGLWRETGFSIIALGGNPIGPTMVCTIILIHSKSRLFRFLFVQSTQNIWKGIPRFYAFLTSCLHFTRCLHTAGGDELLECIMFPGSKEQPRPVYPPC